MQHRRRAGPFGLALALAVVACTAAPAAPTSAAGQRSTTSAPPPVTATPASLTPEAPAPPAPVVVLDPGHNGGNAAAPEQINQPVPAGGFTKPCNTTGTATDAGYPEHAFTFDVAQRAADLLRAAGMTVVLTRTDDSGVGPCVDARAAVANDAGAALVVSVHADGAAPRRPASRRRPTPTDWWSPGSPAGTISPGSTWPGRRRCSSSAPTCAIPRTLPPSPTRPGASARPKASPTACSAT